MELEIGARLKTLRKNKGMSIAELAEQSGVSTGLISQIERDMVVPSVVNLFRIAQVLETDINYFFEEELSQDIQITRRGDHRHVVMERGNCDYQLFTNGQKGHSIDMVMVTLKGGESYSQETLSHKGEECGFVLKGSMIVLVGGKEYRLYEGDSIYFHSSLPHKYLNDGAEDCVSIWAMTPTFF